MYNGHNSHKGKTAEKKKEEAPITNAQREIHKDRDYP